VKTKVGLLEALESTTEEDLVNVRAEAARLRERLELLQKAERLLAVKFEGLSDRKKPDPAETEKFYASIADRALPIVSANGAVTAKLLAGRLGVSYGQVGKAIKRDARFSRVGTSITLAKSNGA